ncbi:MAG: metallophosphoesterase, partial [Candidatus Pacearchaeota archaeon]|nr:metallophosphoesterase [Candidatus Pacearchaeota archaeon]
MVRFGHIADVHLGGWKQQPMQDLNFESFKDAVTICINSKLDFVLFAGDLFDSAYPSIEILKETFAQFKKLKDAGIPCFTIAGSHDYSVSGKTFLDVLEKAGFCKNVYNAEEKENSIILNPIVYGNVAIYGYPGKKSGLEVQDLKKVKFNDSPGLFKIFML